jgi:hypothetical protein
VDGIEIMGSTAGGSCGVCGCIELNDSPRQVSLMQPSATYRVVGDDRTYRQEIHVFEEVSLRPREET